MQNVSLDALPTVHLPRVFFPPSILSFHLFISNFPFLFNKISTPLPLPVPLPPFRFHRFSEKFNLLGESKYLTCKNSEPGSTVGITEVASDCGFSPKNTKTDAFQDVRLIRGLIFDDEIAAQQRDAHPMQFRRRQGARGSWEFMRIRYNSGSGKGVWDSWQFPKSIWQSTEKRRSEERAEEIFVEK